MLYSYFNQHICCPKMMEETKSLSKNIIVCVDCFIRDDIKEINGLFYDAKKSAEILQKNSDKYIS